MIGSLLGYETSLNGMYVNQLNMDTAASNLAQNYIDSNGYVMSSLQIVNTTGGPSILVNEPGGISAVGTGPIVESITRSRSAFLDSQIQSESSIVGMQEVLNSTLNQINTVLNGSTTINSSLNQLATSFSTLAANPTNAADLQTVVNNGVSFANLANNLYDQLQNLQNGINTQVGSTVTQINGYLQQLNSINKQLLANPGTDVNNLLDARDYTITLLSRLVNIQVSYGVQGTATVWLQGLPLVNSAGAAILSTNLIDGHNDQLVAVQYQTPQGSIDPQTVNSLITGGVLGGELQSMGPIIDSYETALNQVVNSVITVTNILTSAGYAASNGTTTGINFFTGTSALNINVNATLIANPSLLGVSSQYGVPANGQIAGFLGNLPNLLANNYMVSQPQMNSVFGNIDPTQPMNSTAATALNGTGSNSTNFNGTITPGTFTIDGTTINFTANESLQTIINQINSLVPNVDAVFNYTQQKIYILSAQPVVMNDGTGDFKAGISYLQNVLTSSFQMNNGVTTADPAINYFTPMNTPYNTQAFQVTPSSTGIFTINGITFTFSNTQSLQQLLGNISAGLGAGVAATFNPSAETITIYNPNTPMTVSDTVGNFSQFTGLNANISAGNASSALLQQATDASNQATMNFQNSSNELSQLNTAQANIAAVSFPNTSGSGSATMGPGVPYTSIEAGAMQDLIAYNASLEMIQILDQMYANLINAVSGGTMAISLPGKFPAV